MSAERCEEYAPWNGRCARFAGHEGVHAEHETAEELWEYIRELEAACGHRCCGCPHRREVLK